VERHLATYDNADEPEQRFRIARLKRLFSIALGNDDYIAMTKIYKGAQEAARMLMCLRDQVPANIALLGLKRRQSAIRSACNEILRRQLEKGKWDVVKALYGSKRRSYFSFFFELVIAPLIPTPNEDHERSLTEFRRLQLVARPPLDQTPESARATLRSMRPRHASVAFGETAVAIRRGRIGRVLRAIATSSRKRAQPMIIATETALSDAEFEELLQLYVKLNETEIDSAKTPSVSGKAEDLARVIRHLATVQRVAALRQAFGKIELKPSARDIVVAFLTNGDVDDVTAVLMKIGSTRHQMHYENHMELCLAARQTSIRSSREIPESIYFVGEVS
jgi:hypothetical protein